MLHSKLIIRLCMLGKSTSYPWLLASLATHLYKVKNTRVERGMLGVVLYVHEEGMWHTRTGL